MWSLDLVSSGKQAGNIYGLMKDIGPAHMAALLWKTSLCSNNKPCCLSFWVTAWLRGYRIGAQQKARLSQMLGASATARMSHAPSGSPRSLQINLSQITLTTALPFSALWPFLSAIKSNQESSRNDKNDWKTFEWSHRALLRRNTAFSQIPEMQIEQPPLIYF